MKKTRTATVPKQIRQEVKTILQHASKNNGVTQAAILFIDDKGVLHSRGNAASNVFNRVVQQAVDNYNLISSIHRAGFDYGWKTARNEAEAYPG